MRLVLAAAMIPTLAGCSTGSGLVVGDSGDATLVSAASNREVRNPALIEGELAITEVASFDLAGHRGRVALQGVYPQ